MAPQTFAVLAKLGFCSKCLQNFSGYSFAHARIFLQVLACLVFSGGSFLKMHTARLSMLVLTKKKGALACSQKLFVTPVSAI